MKSMKSAKTSAIAAVPRIHHSGDQPPNLA
jgi:hypothetical protein